ncbi:MAG TPA: 2-oxoacid:acceptor oxidoreductase family protein [Acidobacteriota bacterium]|nr:2-oxoacid:acceptor oxidoreductase family protein [Acidobacteriota bacterium]
MRITGFGGQGIILAGYIVGKAAAVFDNRHATMTQAYGPEARGSACSSQVIVDEDAILYPYIRKQQILLALSQEGYDKFAPELASDGILLYDEDLVELGTPPPAKVVKSVPATRIAEDLGRVMVANIVMLGFFAAQTDVVSADAMKKAIISAVPKGTGELNTEAFERGFTHQPANEAVAAGV